MRKGITTMMEPGKLGLKESYLARLCMNGVEEKYPVALAYVLSLRSDPQAARQISDNAHVQAFEEFHWDATEESVLALFEQHGFAAEAVEESDAESEDVKKD
jgi:hypothetical protein